MWRMVFVSRGALEEAAGWNVWTRLDIIRVNRFAQVSFKTRFIVVLAVGLSCGGKGGEGWGVEKVSCKAVSYLRELRQTLPLEYPIQHSTTTDRSITQYGVTQHNTTQHNTTQHKTKQHNTTQQHPKTVFERLRFRNGLVWSVDLTIEWTPVKHARLLRTRGNNWQDQEIIQHREW